DAAREAGAAVIIMSHLGRPTEGQYDEEFSLMPVVAHLASLLATEVQLLRSPEEIRGVGPGTVAVLENVRFLTGEKSNDDALARELARSCDVFVMDAFGTAHRAHASTHGVAKFAKEVCAGTLLSAELEALGRSLAQPESPMVAIIGGAKVSSKLEVLGSLAEVADEIIVGGGIANTFMAAVGYEVGRSMHEPALIDTARKIAEKVDIPIPSDVVVATEFSASAVGTVKPVTEVGPEDMILDIGPETARALADRLLTSRTILWNGPVGVFEFAPFAEGTRVLAEAIGASPAYSIAGGGDTLAAVEKFGVAEGLSYISTGGGAFLEFVEGKPLPAVEILGRRLNEGPIV
ncbi:MAG TPA: phosphoglycerate kinase, partial [Gammaproteobacteria bacterium]|nr:phosphoglycerate kinase [Gammaproteobacteria bacterium]